MPLKRFHKRRWVTTAFFALLFAGCSGDWLAMEEVVVSGEAGQEQTAALATEDVPEEQQSEEESKEEIRDEKLEALRELWRSAADKGVPDAALAEFEATLNDPDAEVARLALQALDDLRSFREKLTKEPEAVAYATGAEYGDEFDHSALPEAIENGLDYLEEENFGSGVEDDGLYTTEADNTGYDGETGTFATSETVLSAKDSEVEENIDYSKEIDALASRIRFEPDEEKRSSAVHDLGLYRTEASVDILSEVAIDPDPSVRYLALQSLWYSAADGLDKDGKIKSILQQAVSDSDSRIADLAKQALNDLENLERQNAGETEESFSLPSYDLQNAEDNGAE